MIRHLSFLLFLSVFFQVRAQCPQVYNSLGVLSAKPYFISCTGGAYAVNFQSNTSWGTYTINWGDGSPLTSGVSYSAGTIITHNYSATIDTFVVTLMIPANSCTMNGIVVMEKPVNASIQIPTLGVTQACAPKTLTFTNSSTDVSGTTTFTWNFGDGTPPIIFNHTNAGQNVTHLYNKNTVNCNTQVMLLAKNYCSFGNPTTANFNPIQIFDVDDAQINGHPVHCWPDNMFSFVNTTNRNCLPQGNTFQRQEWWNLGDYWGMGHDSIINWRPWPPATPVNISFPAVGIYTVMLRDSNLCGVDDFVRTISIVNPPVAAVVSPTGNICENTPVTFTNLSSPGPYQHRWNFGTGGGFVNLGAGNKTTTYTAAGTYTVRLVTLINGAGPACTDTAITIVTVQSSPVSLFNYTPATGCDTANIQFTDNSTAAVQWNWSFGNGGTSTLQAPPAQSYTNPGAYSVSLVVTASTGCTHSSNSAFIIRSKPLASFSQFTACVGTPVTFTNNSMVTGTNPINSYSWNLGDGSPPTTVTIPAHTYTAQGTYTVRLIVSTAFCTDSISQAVSLNVKPTASFVISPTVGCPPLNVTFGNQSQNFTNAFWDFGVVPTSTVNTTGPSFTYSNNTQSFQNFTVTLIASTGSGCGDTIKKTLSVRPKPVAGFTANALTGCSPLATTFSNTSVGFQTSSWLFGDGGISSQNNPSHTYSNSSLFTQTVTAQLAVTNSVGCSDTIRQTMTVYPEALTTFSMVPANGCSPLVVNFPSVPGVAVYTWDHGDGTGTFTTTSSHTWTYTNTGSTSVIYTVTMHAQTSNSCTGNGTGHVTVFNNPVASFTENPNPGCSPLNVFFNNTSTGHSNALWTFGNGATSTSEIPSATYTNLAGSPQQTFSVKLVVNTSNHCKDSITRNVILLARPKAAFTPDTPACTPKMIKFSNTSTGAGNFTWDFGDGSALNTSVEPTHLYVNTGSSDATHFVKLVARNADNCADSLYVGVKIHPKPQFFIVSTPDSGCSPLRVFFSKLPGAISYQWKKDDGLFGTTGDFSETFENNSSVTRSFNISLIAKDKNTCYDTARKTIKVYPVPIAIFTADPTEVFIPAQPVVFNNSSTGASSFSWNFGDGGTSKEHSPKHTYTKPGEYEVVLIATSVRNCRDTFTLADKVMAIEESTVAIPNAFSPNPGGSPGTRYNPEDISNDIFHPVIKGADKYQFSVYSRWGELLFDTKDPEEGWDGYYRGKLCTQDIYIWQLNVTFIDGRVVKQTGDVLLLR